MLAEVTDMLAADTPLPPRFRDHSLSGTWDDCRDCHIRPDLVLIYRKPDKNTLQLVRSARIPNSAFDACPEARQRLAKLETS